MSGRQGVRVLALASLVCAGCDGLAVRPGHDLAVRVIDESPIWYDGQIYAPVRFAVTGCNAFELALEDESGATRPIGFTSAPDGTFVASVPTAWMRECNGWVLPDYSEEDEGALVATCLDAARSARAEFFLKPAVDRGRGLAAVGNIRAVFPSDRDDWPWAISTAEFGGESGVGGTLLEGDFTPRLAPGVFLNPLVRPRVARSGTRVFVTLGCASVPDCPLVSIAPGDSVPGERLADIDMTDPVMLPPRGIAHVSTSVVDIAFAEDGALVVVTDSSIARHPSSLPPYDGGSWTNTERWGETIVWRVLPAPQRVQGVVEDPATVIARFPSETVVTRLSRRKDGALTFATVANPTFGHVSVQLYATDGSAVTSLYTAAGETPWCWLEPRCFDRLDTMFINPGIFLSPDGETMIFARDNTQDLVQLFYWMNTSPSDQVWQPFGSLESLPPSDPPPRLLYDPYADGGAVWLTDAVALWAGGDLLYPDFTHGPGLVQVFDATPPRDLRYEYRIEALPGATTAPVLIDALAVGDHLVLTTTTGVRILDAAGQLVGGSDPLPCGATVTAPAELIAPNRVAIGVGTTVLWFDVGP